MKQINENVLDRLHV